MPALRKYFYAALLVSLGSGSILAADEGARTVRRFPVTATVLYGTESVLGKRLVSSTGENAGRIVDVLADESGHVRAAIVDYGGFLGIGSRKIAVAWADLRFEPGLDSDAIGVGLSRESLARAPQVRPGAPVVVASAWGEPASYSAVRK